MLAQSTNLLTLSLGRQSSKQLTSTCAHMSANALLESAEGGEWLYMYKLFHYQSPQMLCSRYGFLTCNPWDCTQTSYQLCYGAWHEHSYTLLYSYHTIIFIRHVIYHTGHTEIFEDPLTSIIYPRSSLLISIINGNRYIFKRITKASKYLYPTFFSLEATL